MLQAPTAADLQRLLQAQSAALAPGGVPPQARVLSETPTSLRLEVTLPNGETAEETITFKPGYNPTTAEIADQQLRGGEIFGAHLSQEPDGGRVTLSYVVATSALPATLRERLYGAPRALTFSFISTAHAQAGASFWTGMDVGMQIPKGIKSLSPQEFKEMKTAYTAYKQIDSALDTSDQYNNWMGKFDAMEECARNPTNTLTQNAYNQDPQYQQQTLDAIQQARSEAKQATGARFVNQEASVAMSLSALKAPGLVTSVTGSVAKWNDSALQQIGDGLVTDTAKLVNCNLARPPTRLAYNDGTISYHMHRQGWLTYDEEDHSAKGVFTMDPAVGGTFKISGIADFKAKVISTSQPMSNKCEGTSELSGGGAYGYLDIVANPVSGSCIYTTTAYTRDIGAGNSDTSFVCRFSNVDLVNGGSYEVQAAGEEAKWTVCSLELKPKQKN